MDFLTIHKIKEKLLLLSIFFLPFTYALVLPFFFPVKVYEVLFSIVVLLSVAEVIITLKIPAKTHYLYKYLILFFIVVLFSTLLSFYTLSNFTGLPDWATDRFAPVYGNLMELLYLAFDILFLIFVANYVSRSEENFKKVLKVVLCSAVVAGLYGFYVFLSEMLGLSTLYLPSPDNTRVVQPFIFMNRIASTFREPNFYAGFLVCLIPITASLFLTENQYSIFSKKFTGFLLIVLLVSLIFTFSTAGLVAVFFSFLFMYFLFLRFGRKLRPTLFLLFLGILLIIVALRTDLYDLLFRIKLFGTEDNYLTLSRKQRIETITYAIELFFRYPLLGIGLGNYSIYLYKILNVYTSFPYIVNNLYFEALCEHGIIGFFLLIVFLLKLLFYHLKMLRKVNKEQEKVVIIGLLSGLIGILVMFNAFPSHSLTFWWFAFGISIGYLWHLEKKYT